MLLAGATGLVGGLLLQRLEQRSDVSSVIALGRKPFSVSLSKIETMIAPIEDWPCAIGNTKPDIAISTLGTTIRAAGSQEAFAAIDHDAVVAFARAARGEGARRFMLVSSVSAHAGSRNHYLAVKGRTEASVQAVGFDRVDIFRPGLLRGNRQGEIRISERFAMLLSPLTDILTPHVLDHFRSIAASDVAAAIAAMIDSDEGGTFIHENRAMWEAAKTAH